MRMYRERSWITSQAKKATYPGAPHPQGPQEPQIQHVLIANFVALCECLNNSFVVLAAIMLT